MPKPQVSMLNIVQSKLPCYYAQKKLCSLLYQISWLTLKVRHDSLQPPGKRYWSLVYPRPSAGPHKAIPRDPIRLSLSCDNSGVHACEERPPQALNRHVSMIQSSLRRIPCQLQVQSLKAIIASPICTVYHWCNLSKLSFQAQYARCTSGAIS